MTFKATQRTVTSDFADSRTYAWVIENTSDTAIYPAFEVKPESSDFGLGTSSEQIPAKSSVTVSVGCDVGNVEAGDTLSLSAVWDNPDSGFPEEEELQTWSFVENPTVEDAPTPEEDTSDGSGGGGSGDDGTDDGTDGTDGGSGIDTTTAAVGVAALAVAAYAYTRSR